jgi:hypothetical protein
MNNKAFRWALLTLLVALSFVPLFVWGVLHFSGPKEPAPPSRFIVTKQNTPVSMFLILDTKTGREYLRTETGTVALGGENQ